MWNKMKYGGVKIFLINQTNTFDNLDKIHIFQKQEWKDYQMMWNTTTYGGVKIDLTNQPNTS